MLLWAIAAAAVGAEPCRDLGEYVQDAWVAFDDAEVDGARARVLEAHEALTCQDRVLTTDELVELYRLDALISLSQEDRPGAVYATIRAVVAAADEFPLDDLGPELQELHTVWLERMQSQQATVSRSGLGDVYVDGHKLVDGVPLQVIQGEHLVQVRGTTTWVSEVVDVSSDYTVETGVVAPPELDEPVVLPTTAPASVATTKATSGGNPRRIVLLAASGVAVLGGAAAIGLASGRESAFLSNPYADPEYGGCAVNDDCYGLARTDAINSDALTTNVMYGVGYGLVAVGVATAGVELLVLPTPTSASANLRVRW